MSRKFLIKGIAKLTAVVKDLVSGLAIAILILLLLLFLGGICEGTISLTGGLALMGCDVWLIRTIGKKEPYWLDGMFYKGD